MNEAQSPLTPEETEALFSACYADPVLFAYTFLPNWYPVDAPTDIAWFQRGILALLTRRANFLLKYGEMDKIIENFVYRETVDGPELPVFSVTTAPCGTQSVSMTINQFLNIYMPRGYSKTTLINTATLYKVLYKERKFLVYISETASHSETQTNSIKSELAGNNLITLVFGNIIPEQRQGLKWTDSFTQFTNGVTLAARGRGAQVRGLNDRGNRPDDIILDDVEDKESVKTAEQREKAATWFYADVLPALPRNDDTATITALGTLLHRDALLVKMEKDQNFHTVKFGAYTKDGSPLWPKFMPAAKIEKLKLTYTRVGQLSSFMMEYMTTVRDDESSKFKEHYILHAMPSKPYTAIALAVDPAISDRVGADSFVIAVVGMCDTGEHFVIDTWGGIGVTPREQVDKIFEMWRLFQPQHVGIESIAYQKALVHLVREEMFRKKAYFEIVPLSHGRTSKHERVEGILQPRYANGYIKHCRVFPELEAELLDWPNGKKDYPDAVAMAISLLDPYAAQAADPEVDLTADEYKPLENAGWAP
tara:strand:+ start:1512 stop:3119 length:1608 start_codon:yes stop_codon:yes gene_type:complete